MARKNEVQKMLADLDADNYEFQRFEGECVWYKREGNAVRIHSNGKFEFSLEGNIIGEGEGADDLSAFVG